MATIAPHTKSARVRAKLNKLDCQSWVIFKRVVRADFAVGRPAKFFKLPQVGLWLLSNKEVGSLELVDESHGTSCDIPEPHHAIIMTVEEGGGGRREEGRREEGRRKEGREEGRRKEGGREEEGRGGGGRKGGRRKRGKER